jgi:HNH endonuclease
VSISTHARKVLWSLSANACARCHATLVRAPEATGDPHAVVGQECHIVAQAPSGPRGEKDSREDIDDYANLILLCANCHAVVDAQPEHFPPEELRRIKRTHEEQVAQRAGQSIPDISLRGRDRPLNLELVCSGDALLALLGPSFSWSYGIPDDLSELQRELLGDFLQACQDWSEAYGEIGPKDHLEAGRALQDRLDALREQELVVYAATRRLTLTDGASREVPWPEVVVKIIHEREVRTSPQPASAP